MLSKQSCRQLQATISSLRTVLLHALTLPLSLVWLPWRIRALERTPAARKVTRIVSIAFGLSALAWASLEEEGLRRKRHRTHAQSGRARRRNHLPAPEEQSQWLASIQEWTVDYPESDQHPGSASRQLNRGRGKVSRAAVGPHRGYCRARRLQPANATQLWRQCNQPAGAASIAQAGRTATQITYNPQWRRPWGCPRRPAPSCRCWVSGSVGESGGASGRNARLPTKPN
jgi:hypothetical protein